MDSWLLKSLQIRALEENNPMRQGTCTKQLIGRRLANFFSNEYLHIFILYLDVKGHICNNVQNDEFSVNKFGEFRAGCTYFSEPGIYSGCAYSVNVSGIISNALYS
jgi:hypothetical protein